MAVEGKEGNKFAVLMINYKQHEKTSVCMSALSPEKTSSEGLRFVFKIVQIPGEKNSFLPKSTSKNPLKLRSAFSIPKDIVYQPYITTLLLQTTFLIQTPPLFAKERKHLIRIRLTEEYCLLFHILPPWLKRNLTVAKAPGAVPSHSVGQSCPHK